jgi:hypothetical protein
VLQFKAARQEALPSSTIASNALQHHSNPAPAASTNTAVLWCFSTNILPLHCPVNVQNSVLAHSWLLVLCFITLLPAVLQFKAGSQAVFLYDYG